MLGAAVRATLIGLAVVSLERPMTDELFVSPLFSNELRPLSLLSSDEPQPLSSGGPWPFFPVSSVEPQLPSPLASDERFLSPRVTWKAQNHSQNRIDSMAILVNTALTP